MQPDFVLPDYGGKVLANLLPSLAARLDGRSPLIDLPEASRYVLLLVDGLGWNVLERHLDHAELMGSLLDRSLRLTCGVPSTTATSLTSLGCGVPPGQHGVVGYTFLDPTRDQVVNALSWEGGPEDVGAFSCHGTFFEAMARQGRPAGAVSLARFADSALTQLAFSGTSHHAVEVEADPEHFVELVLGALGDHDVVYCYERLLDHEGHGKGVGSWQWLERLAHVDDLVAELSQALPDDVALLVTGDHGMVNVPEAHRVVAEEEPALQGFRHIAGEARFRQLYVDADARGLALRWQEFLGDRAVVLTKDEAVDVGWFGPEVTPRVASRIGDVLVAMRGDWGVMSSAYSGEYSLVGMHGSLTADEMYVPLIALGPR